MVFYDIKIGYMYNIYIIYLFNLYIYIYLIYIYILKSIWTKITKFCGWPHLFIPTVPGLFSAWRCHVPGLSKMNKLVGISVVSTGVISQLCLFHSHVAKTKPQHLHWV